MRVSGSLDVELLPSDGEQPRGLAGPGWFSPPVGPTAFPGDELNYSLSGVTVQRMVDNEAVSLSIGPVLIDLLQVPDALADRFPLRRPGRRSITDPAGLAIAA